MTTKRARKHKDLVESEKKYHHRYWIFDKEDEEKVHGKV